MKTLSLFFAAFFLCFYLSAQISLSDSLKIEDLISKMRPEEKAGQLSLFTCGKQITGPAVNSDCGKLISDGRAGAVMNARGVEYIRSLQTMAIKSRLGIPLIFAMDVIHGYRTIFPIPLAQAATWDTALIRKADSIAAMEASSDGINWTFAPMVDIARDPRWGRVSEGAGEDTWLGCRIAEARVRGIQGNGYQDGRHIMACAKHFAAYGAPLAGREYNSVDMSPLSLYEYYLPVYQACVKAGVGTVMSAFNNLNGIPCSSNRWLMTTVLREEWKFRGFVVSDYTAVNELVNHGVAAGLASATALALNAGVDMDMVGNAYLENIPALLNDNKISPEVTDEAVRRVLRAKCILGLFKDPYRFCVPERAGKRIMTRESLEFARRMVAQSCVLLKNENHTLPVPKSVKTIAVIGPLADERREIMGNWTAAGEEKDCMSLLAGIRAKCDSSVRILYEKGCNVNDQETDGIAAAVKAARQADYVILAVGENSEMTGEAESRTDPGIPGIQDTLVNALAETGKPVAAVLFNGRPLTISNLDNRISAILETWFGGTQTGNGITDVLFGDYNPSGKLTMSFPRNTGQIPIFYNETNTGRPFEPENPGKKYVSAYIDSPNSPLFPFGYGLSYTSFRYSEIRADVAGDTLTVSVNVSNTGNFDGVEVIQLYIQQKIASIPRPVRELKGFRKLMIRQGETVGVTFHLTTDDLAFRHPDLRKYFEPGEFNAFVGGNSRDVITTTFKY